MKWPKFITNWFMGGWSEPLEQYALRSPRHKTEAAFAWLLLSRQCADGSKLKGVNITPGIWSGSKKRPALVVSCQTAVPHVTTENRVDLYAVPVEIRLESHGQHLSPQRNAEVLGEVADMLSDVEGVRAILNNPDQVGRPVTDFFLLRLMEADHLGLPQGGELRHDSFNNMAYVQPWDQPNSLPTF